jgi:hypothetical protein
MSGGLAWLSTLLGPEETGDPLTRTCGPGRKSRHRLSDDRGRLFFENCTVDASILSN